MYCITIRLHVSERYFASRHDGMVPRTNAQMHLHPLIRRPGRRGHTEGIHRKGKLFLSLKASIIPVVDQLGQKSALSRAPQPECSKSGGFARVVGQFEGWSIDRDCQPFVPEQIPKGIYTHLSYAYATIDSSTFEVRPGYLRDPAMYRRFTRLRRRDPDLKVYIAIG